ncbi:ribonuclease P protein component [Aliiruegeria haliotis]|uniref:Ribonuclease P protein component n=1 Tax=Aliiruegeria haliotis TaxID=1280846 RepID=A0A2T0RIV0_9RHOB|nr:ribonuclease P protein component [Aliiruegeria haliotis]PRY21134.1 ribonuclease P protein component [Aliiruegeria haliotis]
MLATLTRRADFLAASRAGRAGTSGFLLQARKRKDTEADPTLVRVGFTCSRKVGNAVARNRAKRRLREIARAVLSTEGRPGWDYVLVGRANVTAERPYDDLVQDLREAVDRVHKPRPRKP